MSEGKFTSFGSRSFRLSFLHFFEAGHRACGVWPVRDAKKDQESKRRLMSIMFGLGFLELS